MRHLGEERILDRLENIVHLSEDFEGVDPLAEPMPVKPGQHYQMGGIETDENGETCIEGLYAAGECACASVHGSNRLGGNALPELIVFGKRAGRHAAGGDLEEARIATGKRDEFSRGEIESPVALGEPGSGPAVADGGERRADGGALASGAEILDRAVEHERERIEALLERDTGVNHATVREDLQGTMTRYVNVFREESGLKTALEGIREARERYRDVSVSDPSRTFNTDLIHTIETRNLLDVAEAITVSALAREEFRGAHWRKEHRERKDDGWLRHTMLSWNGGEPELWYRPVELEGENKTYEPKVRSY
jgi:succinate dehydrogenase / fumarate reductase flavoprotein subunit